MAGAGDIPLIGPQIGIIMGSRSDWPTMKRAAEMLAALDIVYETKVVSAHRTPDRLYEYASSAKSRALRPSSPAPAGQRIFRA